MSVQKPSLRTAYPYVFVFLSTILTFFLLFVFRFSDDNRLTSWKWTFAHADFPFTALLLLAGVILAYLLSRFPFLERRPVFFLFFSAYAVSLVFWQEPEVIVDVSRYFTQAKYLEIFGIPYFFKEWGRTIFVWTDMPLVPFLYGMIFRLLGESRVFIQMFTSFLFAMTAVITFCIGRTLWDEFTGFIGGSLLLGIPFLLTQGPLMLVDVPTMFFLTLSVLAFIRALEKGKVYTLCAAIIIFLTVFSKFSTWPMLSVLGVILAVCLIHLKIDRKILFQRCFVTFCCAGVLILIPLVLKWDVFYGQMQFLREYQAPGLKRWGESFLSTFFFQTHPFITLFSLIGVTAAFRKRDGRFLILCWMLIIVIIFQVRRARYVMIIFPMLTLMASYGLQGIKSAELRKFIVFCAVFSSLVTAVFAYLPFLRTMSVVNFQDAGRFLDTIDERDVEVITLPADNTAVNSIISIPILDLFTTKRVYRTQDPGISRLPEKVKTSPLRFTWEYPQPVFYGGVVKAGAAVAVVSNGGISTLPDDIRDRLRGYRKTGVFGTSSGIFRYRPMVVIYQVDREDS